MAWFNAQFGAFVVALAAVIGSTVAVCLGKIDASTYIAVVTAFGGVGVGAGVHAQGVSSGAAATTTINGGGGGGGSV